MKFSAAFLFVAGASSAMAFAPQQQLQRQSTTSLNSVLTKVTGRSSLDPAVIAKYDSLPFPADTILAEYVWVRSMRIRQKKYHLLNVLFFCRRLTIDFFSHHFSEKLG
jgi:hypothetical protein